MLGGRPIESLQKRVLKVSLVRNTRILELATTLPDARKAQALARFLAESTVDLNRSMVSEGDRDLLHGLEQQETDARARLDRIEGQWASLLANEPVDDLKSSMESAAELRAKLQQDVFGVEVELADAADRAKQSGDAEAQRIRADAASAQARVVELRKQMQALDKQAGERERLIALRMAHRDTLWAERKAGQTELATIEATLREARSNAGFRGERLRIIDPGIVPERPSSPNLPLNLAGALLAGLVLPLLYLAIELNFLEQRAIGRRDLFQTAAKSHND